MATAEENLPDDMGFIENAGYTLLTTVVRRSSVALARLGVLILSHETHRVFIGQFLVFQSYALGLQSCDSLKRLS